MPRNNYHAATAMLYDLSLLILMLRRARAIGELQRRCNQGFEKGGIDNAIACLCYTKLFQTASVMNEILLDTL